MRELYLFAPIRQGGVETGLAVIAVGAPEVEPEQAEGPEVLAEAAEACGVPATTDHEPAGDGGAEPGAPGYEPVLSTDAEVVRAVVLAAEAAAEATAEERTADALACDPTEDAAGPVPVAEAAAAGEAKVASEMPAVTDTSAMTGTPEATEASAVVEAPEAIEAPAAERFTVYTARYRLQLKGPDRGKWDVEVVAEADAPLLTVDVVVRGVQRRAGELTEIERLGADDVRRILAEGV
jgi:hypothetical protein